MATSKLQCYTGQELRRRFAKYGIVENTRPDWLISSKGERLELDFYLERLGMAIEVQGKQHFEFAPMFHATKQDFAEQLRRDREKLEICQQAGIDLLYVCEKSDLELVLTACYDVLAPKSDDTKPEWTLAPPAWMIQARGTKRAQEKNRLISCWLKGIEKENAKDEPRIERIEKLEKLIEATRHVYY